jgi:hypothetical protein
MPAAARERRESLRVAKRYREIVNHVLAPALGNLRLAKLAPTHIE